MSARGTSVAFIVALLAAAAFAFSAPPAIADQPETEEGRKAAGSDAEKADGAEAGEKDAEPVRTYTNADLERMFGPPEPPKSEGGKGGEAEPASGGPRPPNALDAMEDAQARARTRELQAAEMEKVVAEKRARVEMLEQRILRIRNPLLPRPEVDLTPEERTEWAGLTAPQRVELTQAQLDQAKKELADAETRLQKLRSN